MIIGIDQGTSGTRGILMDREGRVRETIHLAHEQIQPRSGWVEHDPIEIWTHVEHITRELATKAGSLGNRVEGIGIANQGETVLAWNRQTSEPVSRAIVWQDTRTQEWIDRYSADEALCRYVSQTTGLHLDSYFSASKMRWILDHVPAAHELAAKDRLCFGTLDAWLIWKFTSGRTFVTDASTAARTQLMNLAGLEYDQKLLQLFEIPADSLPTIIACDCHIEVEGFGPQLDGVPIAASLVDQPAAVFGHACLYPGQSKATYGTGCFVYLNCGDRPPLVTAGLLSTLAWDRKQGRAYAFDGGVLAVASVVTWLKDRLGMLDHARGIDARLAGHEPKNDVVCVTAHAGLGSPIWDRNARAAWLGMDLSTGRDDLVYAALEGIAFRVAQVIHIMDEVTQMPISALRADGGLSRCNTLMQLQANLLGRPVEVVAATEATALGVACFAARSLSIWEQDDEVVTRVTVEKTFVPQSSRDQRMQRMQRLTQAQQLARTWSET